MLRTWRSCGCVCVLLLLAVGKLFRYALLAGGWAGLEAVVLPRLFS